MPVGHDLLLPVPIHPGRWSPVGWGVPPWVPVMLLRGLGLGHDGEEEEQGGGGTRGHGEPGEAAAAEDEAAAGGGEVARAWRRGGGGAGGVTTRAGVGGEGEGQE